MVQNQQQNQPQPQVESAEAEEKPKGGVESPVMAVTEEERLRMHLQQQQISAQMQQQPMNINTSFNIGAFAGALPARASGGSQQQPGTIKVGFYEVDRTIGKGNYAVVKLARHRITKTEVAIKIVDKRRLDANNLAKIYREIEVLKKLRHPHIVRLYQVMETNNMLYLVTEYAPNGEIFDLISKQHRLTEENAREKFWQIISAVDYLHNMNIVHRDLKAENLLLDANFQIKLADFGFSNFFSPHDTLNTFCGSPPYAAPEVFEGKRYEGPEIDIWSLGVILYVMVCGALPFEGMNLQLLRDRVLSGRIRIPYFMSSDCEHLIRKMLTVDPRRRPTIDQIKQHRWMRFGQYAAKYGQQSQQQQMAMANQQQQQQEPNGQQPPPEPHPQILRLMNNIGIESHKVRTALQMDAYDNFQAIYLLLLERLQQRGSPSLSPSQSSSAANTAPGSGGQSAAAGIATASSASSLPASPPILLQQQNVVATAAAAMQMQPKLQQQQQQPSSPQRVVANMVINSPTSPKAPALVLTASPINPIISPEANRLIRGVKARRQSDGVAVLGGGMAPCQCCCCTAALQQPIGRRLPLQPTTAQLVSRQAALAFAHQMQQQQAVVAEAAGEGQQPVGHQHPIGHHPSTSDYESENCCSGSSAAGSTLSRQSTIGTINSFDEGIPDDAATGSGLLMFAAAAAHCSFHGGGGGGGGTFFHEQLPAFDSQLSQDPLFSSQSSNNSAAAFRMGSSSSNGPPGSEDVPSCCCSASSTGVSAGGTGGNLVRHVQLHPHCPGGIGQGHHQHPGHLHHHHHGHTHQHLLKPYWFPAVVARQPQQIQSARDASTGEGGSEHQQQSSGGEASIENASSSAHHGLFGVQQQWRASDNSIGDSLTFPTGQLGKRNRAMHELHRPQQQQQQQATGIAQPLLHNQLRRMRISTGLATLAKAVPLALGVTASPILSAGICGNMVGAQQQHQQQQQLSSPSSSSASSAASPLDKRPPAPASASAVRQVLGCLPKRISLPENLEFQPQMLLNLKQSIHVEKQLTSNPDAVSADPSSGGCSELSGFDKPMLMKTSRLQHYQQQQQQKRKAARLQLLRQQSYHIAQKQSVISSSLPMNLNSSSHSCGGSPTALNFHPKGLLQLQTSASPTAVQKMFDDHAMEDGEDAASENNNNTGGGSSSSGNPKNNRIPLSPIEDLKAEEVMDTT